MNEQELKGIITQSDGLSGMTDNEEDLLGIMSISGEPFTNYEAGVYSFNRRTEHVMPMAGDYSKGMVGVAELSNSEIDEIIGDL